VSFSSLSSSSRSRRQPGTGKGWHVAEVAGQGRFVQFGNDDVARKALGRGSVVGLFDVSDGFSVLCRVAVESELRWSVPVAMMMGNRWLVDDSVGASPAYLSRGACRLSRSCLTLACVADCWHEAGGEAQVVMFHNIIGAFVYGFRPVFLLKCPTLFDLINEYAIS
jgi:hypothetical protein